MSNATSAGPSSRGPSGRALLVFLLAAFTGAVALGCLAAPPVFNLLLGLGRAFPALEGLRDVEFESIATRAVSLLSLAAGLVVLRFAGMRIPADLGFAPGAGWAKSAAAGFGLGCASFAAAALGGWCAGAYRVEALPAVERVESLALFLVGAALVGLMEETLFRGALFGVLRRGLGVLPGAVVCSLIFSLVHFARPKMAAGVVHGGALSGFRVLPLVLHALIENGARLFPFALTLFAMGLALCLFYQSRGRLYFCIGLHAGWVWAIRAGGLVLQRDPARWPGLLGRSDLVAESWLALFITAVFLAAALREWNRTRGNG